MPLYTPTFTLHKHGRAIDHRHKHITFANAHTEAPKADSPITLSRGSTLSFPSDANHSPRARGKKKTCISKR